MDNCKEGGCSICISLDTPNCNIGATLKYKVTSVKTYQIHTKQNDLNGY
jgi:hypothetical protein